MLFLCFFLNFDARCRRDAGYLSVVGPHHVRCVTTAQPKLLLSARAVAQGSRADRVLSLAPGWKAELRPK